MFRLLAAVLRAALAIIVVLGLGAATLMLATVNNDFPVHYHADEFSKVNQVRRPGDLNYNHPLLLLEGTIQLRRLLGEYVSFPRLTTTRPVESVGRREGRPDGVGRPDSLTIARQGRLVSALMAALCTVGVAVAGYRWAGFAGLAALGGTMAVAPPLMLYGHYMKEDAPLAGGIGLVIGAAALMWTGKRWWTRLPVAGLLGAAVAVAASGKAVGAATAVPAVMALLFAPAPGLRLRTRLLLEVPGRVVVAVALAAGTFVTINHRAFEFSGPWPVPKADARQGIESELEHAISEHGGVRLRQPNTYAVRAAYRHWPVPTRVMLGAGVAVMIGAVGVAVVRRLRGRGRTAGMNPAEAPETTPPAEPAMMDPAGVSNRPRAHDRASVVPYPGFMLFLGVLGLTYAAVLGWNAIPFVRYALPLMLMGFVGAGVGIVLVARAIGRGRGVVRAGALVGLLAVTVGVQGWWCGDLARQFAEDSRQRLREFIGTLPPRTRIVADPYAGLSAGGDPFRFPGQARLTAMQFEPSMFVVDTGSPEQMARRGVEYVVICGLAYERFLDRDVVGAEGDARQFERRRDAYRRLLGQTPVWSAGSEYPTESFTNPTIHVYRLPLAPAGAPVTRPGAVTPSGAATRSGATTRPVATTRPEATARPVGAAGGATRPTSRSAPR